MSTYQDERVPFPSPGRLRRELRLRRPPWWMLVALALVLVLMALPVVLIARARATKSDKPRVRLIQDMANQPRYSTQQPSEVFADGRAMRLPPTGVVAHGTAIGDDHLTEGYHLVTHRGTGRTEVEFYNGLPSEVHADEATLHRGAERYHIYCAPCHGADASGNGPIHLRALKLGEAKWVAPVSLLSPEVRGRADGHLYNTIRRGIRAMPAYGPQIEVADRWAIVLYLRSLQQQSIPLNSPAITDSRSSRP